MKRVFLILSLSICTICMMSCKAYARYDESYNLYISRGVEALEVDDFKKALLFFKSAYAIDPQRSEALHYINLTQRLKSGQVLTIEDSYDKQPSKPVIVPERPDSRPLPMEETDQSGQTKITVVSSPYTTTPKNELFESVIDLDDELWGRQPNTALEIEIRKSLTLRREDIERFLVVEEGFIDIERLSHNELRLTALKRGGTFLHVWDKDKRWTFRINIVLPQHAPPTNLLASTYEEIEEPFKIEYSNLWTSLYRGDSLNTAERQNLTFSQWVGIFGPTPYGKVDGSLNFYKFDQSTEIIGKSIGLTDGKIGPFRDFTIRGYDTSKEFSELTLPGRSFRGFLMDAYAFHRRMKYSLLQGQDRATFSVLAPGIFDVKKSYIEGAKLTLFPDEKHQLSMNYVRGYGEIRSNELKERSYSLQTRHLLDGLNIDTEYAYDGDETAYTVKSHFQGDRSSLDVNLRDINKDYFTITGRPSDNGEVGGSFRHYWNPETFIVRSFLDIYRDRDLFDPDNVNSLNFDFNTNLTYPLDLTSNINTSLYYIFTPQLISPQDSFSINNVYSKSIKLVGNRNLSLFLGNSFQKTRFEKTPESEYDRYGVRTGFSLPLLRDVSYFANYYFYWAKDTLNNEYSHPGVFTTGLSYSPQITKTLLGNFSINYRDEERTDEKFSFLAGEDSLTGSIGLNYRPVNDVDFFMDGRVRNVWAESNSNDAYNEIDVRAGVRSGWDLPFRWNPTADIGGFVFKDYNTNGKKDENEPGIPDLIVKVGKKVVKTDYEGEYFTSVHAKKVKVFLDADSIPQGHILTTPLEKDIIIEHLKTVEINFGLTSQSGIYGVVFNDTNDNATPERDEPLIPNVRITLDGKVSTKTAFDGSYFLDNISPGKHTLSLDINSLDIHYLPKIKLDNEVEVKEGTTFVFHIPVKKAKE